MGRPARITRSFAAPVVAAALVAALAVARAQEAGAAVSWRGAAVSWRGAAVVLASAPWATSAEDPTASAPWATSAEDPAGSAPEEGPPGDVLVSIERPMAVTSRPGGGRVVGRMPAGSRYYGTPTVAWVLRTTEDGRFGLVPVPYAGTRAFGWIRLRGLRAESTSVVVRVDLSRHLLVVERRDEVVYRTRAATGAPSTPTPRGRYFVTDRVRFPAGHVYGSFAFGISGIQPRLPAGWSGGDQLAIHGTNQPSTIGRSVSAGCVRVSEAALGRLRPLLRLGTPVIVEA